MALCVGWSGVGVKRPGRPDDCDADVGPLEFDVSIGCSSDRKRGRGQHGMACDQEYSFQTILTCAN